MHFVFPNYYNTHHSPKRFEADLLTHSSSIRSTSWVHSFPFIRLTASTWLQLLQVCSDKLANYICISKTLCYYLLHNANENCL